MNSIVLIDEITKLLCIFIPIGLAIILVVTLLILLTVKRKKHGIKVKIKEADEGIYVYLGGKENIKSYSLNGSRLTLELIDQSRVDKDGLKKKVLVECLKCLIKLY